MTLAIFVGTPKEFIKFLGSLVRNRIQQITKTHKRALKNVCQDCKETKELQAAHVKGTDRNSMIKTVLEEYTAGSTGNISCDIGEALAKIMKAHDPIEKSFKFLCEDFHKKYDADTTLL